ncbi:YNFM family putative membrane transporter [Sporosarcina luteola]|nr:YNFM family putative membrane transporter [Sporosarcina luteola]
MVKKQGYTARDAAFWKIIFGTGLSSVFIFAAMYAMQPLLPVFTKEFSISVSYASMAMSVTTIGLIVGLIILGFMSDRTGRRMYIKLSLFGSILPFLLIPSVDSFWQIVVLRFVQGFALAGVPAAALAYISEEVDKKYANLATALYISCNSLGGMIGRFLTGYMAEQASWQFSLYILAAFGGVLFCFVCFLLPKSKHFTSSTVRLSEDLEGFFYHLKNPSLLLVFGLGIVLQLSFTGIWTYAPFHLLAPPFRMTLEMISYLYLAYSFGVVGGPIGGWLSGKFGLDRVRLIAIFLFSTGILLTLSSNTWLLIVGFCVICLGFFTAHSLTAASVSKEATHHKGSASSLYLVSYYVGVTLGSTLLSPWWNAFGWSGLVVLTAILPILYVGFLQFRRRKYQKGSAAL